MNKVEYLISIKTNNGIGTDIASFNSIICSKKELDIENQNIIYNGIKFEYSIEQYDDISPEDMAYHVCFSYDDNEKDFSKMLRAFNVAVGKITTDILTIWNDLGFERCKLLYSRIYIVENSLRKLISKFMLIKLGPQWHKKALPQKVKSDLKQKNKDSKIENDILYNADFIALNYFFFVPYPAKDINQLKEGTKQKDLIDFIPKNNWDRYFSQIVDCETGELEKKLDKLYQIRCKVAHNNALSLEEYNEGIEYCEFIDPLIEEAIKHIENIEVADTDIYKLKSNLVANAFLSGSVFLDNNIDYLKTMENLKEQFSSQLSCLYPITQSSAEIAIRTGQVLARIVAQHTGIKSDNQDNEENKK